MTTKYESIQFDRPLRPLIGAAMTDSVLAHDGYVIQRDGDTVTVTHPQSTECIQVPWARVLVAWNPRQTEKRYLVLPSPELEAQLRELDGATAERVTYDLADDDEPSASDVVYADPPAMSDEMRESLERDGSIPPAPETVPEPPKRRGGWPKGKPRKPKVEGPSEP